jgi:hypothetical protein
MNKGMALLWIYVCKITPAYMKMNEFFALNNVLM